MDIYTSDSTIPDASPELLGGKGYGLYEMTRKGYPVPPFIIIPTTEWARYHEDPEGWTKELAAKLADMDGFFHEKFGYAPLVSVRSGARVSMPGMMDTVLNVGLSEENLPYWQKKIGKKCADQSFGRLVEMYANVVKGHPRELFSAINNTKARLNRYREVEHAEFPDPAQQIVSAVEAVFKSWDNERAQTYRSMHGIPEDWGTACVIQAMVFGNMDFQSATGVLFTRNPDTGERGLVGEFLVNAQGEDVVAGIRTPEPWVKMHDWSPSVANQLLDLALAMEKDRKDVQDIEFTVQSGVLYLLQTRNAKRTPLAAVRIAVDMHEEGLLSMDEALQRVPRATYLKAFQPTIAPDFDVPAKYTGIAACSGVVTGKIVRTAEEAIAATEPVILVTKETNPDDIGGMQAAAGVLTMTGGTTSHAAVVARGMNKPCVVGLGQKLTAFPRGKRITIDGGTGRVWNCPVPVVDPLANNTLRDFGKLMAAKAEVKRIDVADADLLDVTSLDPAQALAHVLKALDTYSTVVVDVTPNHRDDELAAFFGMYTKEPEYLKALEGVPMEQRERVVLLTSTTPPQGFKQMACVSSLENLIDLPNGTYFIYRGSVTPRVSKVLTWLKGDGAMQAQVGVVGPGAFASDFQLAAKLLT